MTQRIPFDPSCTVWATFAELVVGDRIDYWGEARPVVEHTAFADDPYGRVRILVENGVGHDVALAPGGEGTWRAPREGEK